MKKVILCNFFKDVLFYFSGKILLKIDYSQTIEQMIADCKFDKVACFQTEDFHCEVSKKEVIKSAKLFKFSNFYNGTKAIKRMKSAGYKPATIQDLLALAKVKPNLQRRYWVASLENYSEKNRYNYQVSMLRGNDHFRDLINDGWGDSFLKGNGIYCLGIKD